MCTTDIARHGRTREPQSYGNMSVSFLGGHPQPLRGVGSLCVGEQALFSARDSLAAGSEPQELTWDLPVAIPQWTV